MLHAYGNSFYDIFLSISERKRQTVRQTGGGQSNNMGAPPQSKKITICELCTLGIVCNTVTLNVHNSLTSVPLLSCEST